MEHVHHWQIASLAIDGKFPAVCRDCRATRAYPIEPPDRWGNVKAPPKKRDRSKG